MVGPEQIHAFYSRGRVIKEGVHTVETLLCDGPNISVSGQFIGSLHDDSPLKLRFADFFEIDPEGQIRSRRTFFYTQLA